MFFEKVDPSAPAIFIDGVKYEMTSVAVNDTFKYKGYLVDVYNTIDPEIMETECTFETYNGWNKELIKQLKAWDGAYCKHIKAPHPEMLKIHEAAMMPLTLLMKSNSNFGQLEKMLADKDGSNIPEFRGIALEEQFCKHLSEICRIFKEFGDMSDHTYDIAQLLKTLKLEDGRWTEIVPFEHYLTPLKIALQKVREQLLKMEKDGPLFVKYIVEDNKELQDLTIAMVKQDHIVQWLVGDSLKLDQFRFLYECMKVIYDSALKEKLLAEDKVVMESVIPKLVAFKSVMAMRGIQLAKAEEMRKAKEKKAKNELIKKTQPRKASPTKKVPSKSKSPGKSKSPSKSPEKSKSPGKTKKGKKEEVEEEVPEEKDPLELTEEEIYLKRMSDEANVDLLFMSEEQLRQHLEEAERKRFGRYWIWDGYFNEKNQQKWLNTAEALKHVNDQVIEDIEDYILLEAFKPLKEDKVQKLIDEDQKERIANEKKLRKKGADEYFKQATEDQVKRKQFDSMRPPLVWNFFQDASEEKIPHVLRANACPQKCYEDGRIEEIQENINLIGYDLLKCEEDKWKILVKHTMEVFRNLNKKYQEALVGGDKE